MLIIANDKLVASAAPLIPYMGIKHQFRIIFTTAPRNVQLIITLVRPYASSIGAVRPNKDENMYPRLKITNTEEPAIYPTPKIILITEEGNRANNMKMGMANDNIHFVTAL